MGEVTEKIYCCDRGDNDNALAAAILAGNNRRDGSRCYYRGQWKNGNLRYS